jgi:hypothetical protein
MIERPHLNSKPRDFHVGDDRKFLAMKLECACRILE